MIQNLQFIVRVCSVKSPVLDIDREVLEHFGSFYVGEKAGIVVVRLEMRMSSVLGVPRPRRCGHSLSPLTSTTKHVQ